MTKPAQLQGALWALSLMAFLGPHSATAQPAGRIGPQRSAEDALAAMVEHSAVIFAGEVYAIRVPAGAPAATPVRGGMPSSRADAVEVEFRVDMGVRGASIGSNYILRMPLRDWQEAPPFRLHERAVVFLRPPGVAGLSGPVQGDADIPGLDVGVVPVDAANNADLNRLHRLVPVKRINIAAELPPPSSPGTASQLPGVGRQGEDDLLLGASRGSMPELRNGSIPFLALLRDVSVLSAAEGASAR